MSTQEQSEIAAQELLRYAEAKKRMAALRAKARQYASLYQAMANELTPGSSKGSDHRQQLEILDMGYPPREHFENLVRDIRETESNIMQLGISIRQMGYDA